MQRSYSIPLWQPILKGGIIYMIQKVTVCNVISAGKTMDAGRSLLAGLMLACLSIAASPVFADEKAQKADGSASQPLQGGVVEVQVTLNDLRDARLSISRVRKAAANLYDEMTRQQVTMNYNPNLVGTTVITIPTPSFTGQMLPARKKWVDESMSEIGPIIKLFKEDVDHAVESNRHTNVDDKTRKQLDPLREDAFAMVQASTETFKALERATASGPSYDNSGIATLTKTLDSQMRQLDKSMKKGISILQKEEKSSKKKA